MNIFRFIGDMSHLASTVILLVKILARKSCAGISLKTVELYLVVYLTRYADLHYTFHWSWYNSGMKLIFLGSTCTTTYLMRRSQVYQEERDSEEGAPSRTMVILPCVIMAALFTARYTLLEVLWTFSVLLETWALIPQLLLISRLGGADSLTEWYTFLLGQYRIWYILNWCFRSLVLTHSIETILWICAVIQSLVFGYFMITNQMRELDPRPDAVGSAPTQVELQAPLLDIEDLEIATEDGK